MSAVPARRRQWCYGLARPFPRLEFNGAHLGHHVSLHLALVQVLEEIPQETICQLILFFLVLFIINYNDNSWLWRNFPQHETNKQTKKWLQNTPTTKNDKLKTLYVWRFCKKSSSRYRFSGHIIPLRCKILEETQITQNHEMKTSVFWNGRLKYNYKISKRTNRLDMLLWKHLGCLMPVLRFDHFSKHKNNSQN